MNQQPRSHFVIGSEDQRGVQLLTLKHVMLQDSTQLFYFFTLIVKQRNNPLVGLLPREAGFGIKCDRAFPFIVHIDHRAQPGIRCNLANDRRRRPQSEIRLYFSHGQFDRPIPEDLENQRTVELDVGLHQGGCCHHFTQHLLHRLSIGVGLAARRPTLQNLSPRIGQTHHNASHGQTIK